MQDLIKILICCNLLQIYTIFSVQALNYKTQSTYLFEYLSISSFAVSCFGQWRMSLHLENIYRGLNHIFLVPDTLKSYTCGWLTYTEIVNWLADQLIYSCRTNFTQIWWIVTFFFKKHITENVWNARRKFKISLTFSNIYKMPA